MNVFKDLEQRDLVYQITDSALLESQEKFTFYVGFDPTSDSLHIGSLLPLATMRRLQLDGHTPIVLVGGATGMIGDPSGKSAERNLLDKAAIEKNIAGIRKNIEKILSFEGPNAAILVNNYDWFEQINLIDFLRDVGKHCSVNAMIAKDSVNKRITDASQGISFTEFSYMLLQGYDFYHLHQKNGCRLQLGGSDQWGNITEGMELIRRMHFASTGESAPQGDEEKVFGLTFPLVVKSDGQKFGKTESGNVWLDPEKTSAYNFYQFLIQTADADAEKLLKYFSFKPLDEVEKLIADHRQSPEKRLAQKALAAELTAMIHGDAELQKIEKASSLMFSQDLGDMSEEDFQHAFGSVPSKSFELSMLNEPIALIDILAQTDLAQSKGAARREITGGGIYLNNERVTEIDKKVDKDSLLIGQRLLLRKGKKKYFIVQFQ